MKLSYSVEETSKEQWQAVREGTVTSCRKRTLALLPPRTSREYDFREEVAKTLVRGDRKHAFPYTATFRENVPISGTFDSTVQDNSWATASDFSYCGTSTNKTTKWSGDIGYFVRNSLTLDPPPVDAPLMLSLKQQAETKALADLRRSYMNIPLLFAERVETINMIRDKGLQLASLVRARQSTDLRRWMKSRGKDRRRVARDISNEHLAFLFGVLPLVSEIEGAVDLYRAEKSLKLTGRGRAAKEFVTKTPISSVPVGTGIVGPYAPCYHGERELTTRYSHRCSLSTVITSSALESMRDFGFNPIATFYDLVPLSFLSDFISNLGTFLRAHDPLLGVQFETGSTTSWRELKENLRVSGSKTSFTNVNGRVMSIDVRGAGEGYTRALHVNRGVLTDYPDATLLWVNNLSLSKAATLASLAIQRYLKPLRPLLRRKQFRYRGPRPKFLPPINYR